MAHCAVAAHAPHQCHCGRGRQCVPGTMYKHMQHLFFGLLRPSGYSGNHSCHPQAGSKPPTPARRAHPHSQRPPTLTATRAPTSSKGSVCVRRPAVID